MFGFRSLTFLFLSLASYNNINGDELIQYADQVNHATVLQISIPKSGTHLFGKLLKLLIKENPTALCLYSGSDPYLSSPHLKCTEFNKNKILSHNLIKFFIYRDPRDQLISFIFYLANSFLQGYDSYQQINQNPVFFVGQYNQGNLGIYPFDYAFYEKLPFDALVHHFINFGSPVYDRMSGPNLEPSIETTGIKEFYDSYLPWMHVDGFCSVRFEDLVGSKGGGNDEVQVLTIKKIAKHIGIEFSDAEILNIAQNLFGDSPTFREGQIGSWKKHFTEEHKRDFKKIAGQLLIDLDYETDLEW